ILADAHAEGRLLLLTDGEANLGIVDPAALKEMAAGLRRQGLVMSTVGVGLEFNETLLASLADQAMGSFTYLDTLAALPQIFARELSDDRNLFARESELRVNVPDGVQLVDAGGYPCTRDAGSVVRIPTGQLLADTRKSFFLTFKVPAANTGK